MTPFGTRPSFNSENEEAGYYGIAVSNISQESFLSIPSRLQMKYQ